MPADHKIPHIVILFDQWEGFLNGIGDNCQSSVGQAVLGLLREGASAGIHLLIAGDRSLLSSRTNSLVEHKYLLRLADRTDYAMAGLSPRELPEKIGAGRAFESATSRETQFAVLDADVSSQAQVRALGAIGEGAVKAQGGVDLVHVPAVFKDLPVKVSYPQVLSAAGGARALVPWMPCAGYRGPECCPGVRGFDGYPDFYRGWFYPVGQVYCFGGFDAVVLGCGGAGGVDDSVAFAVA